MGHGELSSLFEATLGLPRGTIGRAVDGDLAALVAGTRTNPTPKSPAAAEAMDAALAAVPKPILHTWFWPDAKPFAVALSHDVDEVRWSWRRRLLMAARHPRTPFDKRERYWNFERILSLEKRFGVRSSWYFVADGDHPRDPPYRLADVADVMRDLRRQGHEVGVHGSFLSFRDGAMLARERRAVSDVLGAPVPGVRQHFVNFEPGATWRLQEDAGFAYDATLALNEVSGFRTGMCHPFVPPGHRIVEIPLILMDGQLFWYERFTREQALANCEQLAGIVADHGGLLSLNWHQHTYDGYSFPGWWDVYERMLESLTARGPAFLTGEETSRWWRLRASVGVSEIWRRARGAEWTVRCPDRVPGLTLRLHGTPGADLDANTEHQVAVRGDDTFLVLPELPADEPVTVTAGW